MKKFIYILFFVLSGFLYYTLTARDLTRSGQVLIKKYEGLRLRAYPDPATHDNPYTIGYGHTGKDVYLGLVITQSKADLLFILDSKRFTNYVTKQIPLTAPDSIFDMATSGCYNFGYLIKGNLKTYFWDSKDNYFLLSTTWLKYCHAAGLFNKGLYNRRVREEKHGGILR